MMQQNEFFRSVSPPKRVRSSPVITLLSPKDLDVYEEEIGEELCVGFAIDVEFIVHQLQSRCFWSNLRVLNICPSFNDHDIPAILNLNHPLLCFPSLESLVIKNHAVCGIRLNQISCPRLQSLIISHPLGISIDVFELNLPRTLREVCLEYLVVRDGYGFTRSLDRSMNSNLQVVKKFATTVYLSGVV